MGALPPPPLPYATNNNNIYVTAKMQIWIVYKLTKPLAILIENAISTKIAASLQTNQESWLIYLKLLRKQK